MSGAVVLAHNAPAEACSALSLCRCAARREPGGRHDERFQKTRSGFGVLRCRRLECRRRGEHEESKERAVTAVVEDSADGRRAASLPR